MLDKSSNQVFVNKNENISLGYELSELFQLGHIGSNTVHEEPRFFDFSGWQAFQVAAGLLSIYLCKIYLQTILQEAAKDHYKYVKQKLTDILTKRANEAETRRHLVVTFEILLGDNLFVRFTLPQKSPEIDKAIDAMFLVMQGMIERDDALRKELVSTSKKTPLIQYLSDDRWEVNYLYQNETGRWAIRYNCEKENSNKAN